MDKSNSTWRTDIHAMLKQSGAPGFVTPHPDASAASQSGDDGSVEANGMHSPAFKVQVALAAIESGKPAVEIATEYDVHPNEVKAWSAKLRNEAVSLFSGVATSVPRSLPSNPYGGEHSNLPLPEQVKVAADASAKFGRTIGAIVMHVAARDNSGEMPEITLVEDVASHLYGKLRRSDYCAPFGKDSIVIYLSLLHTVDDLHSIARRMHNDAVHFLDNTGHPQFVLSPPGTAYFPDDGDTAASLYEIAASRAIPCADKTQQLRYA